MPCGLSMSVRNSLTIALALIGFIGNTGSGFCSKQFLELNFLAVIGSCVLLA